MSATRTCFKNGLARKNVAVKGGTASATFAVPTSFGVAIGDTVDQVLGITIGATGVITTTIDLTSEFAGTVTAANQLNNSGGTNTTGLLLMAIINDVSAGQ